MKNPPAFPRPSSSSLSAPLTEQFDPQSGMTLLDYFAAKALQSLIALKDPKTLEDYQAVCKWAYLFGNAMLEERSKQ